MYSGRTNAAKKQVRARMAAFAKRSGHSVHKANPAPKTKTPKNETRGPTFRAPKNTNIDTMLKLNQPEPAKTPIATANKASRTTERPPIMKTDGASAPVTDAIKL